MGMTESEQCREFLIDCLLPNYRPRERRPIGDWAKKNIVLAVGENKKFAGQPYDIKRTVYNDRLFQFIQDDHSRELIFIKGSQAGFTLSVFVAIAWILEHSPGNVLYATDTIPNAKELGKRRMHPIISQISKEVADRMEDNDQTGMLKEVNGVLIKLVGAASASGFVSWPISYGFVDEAEIHEVLPEGSTISLTRARFKADDDYKMCVFSKPQDEPQYSDDRETGRKRLATGAGTLAYDEYLSGTQEKLMVPCPHCQHPQELRWSQVRYDHCRSSLDGVIPIEYDPIRILRETFYECEGCGEAIKEHHKEDMILAGEWIPAEKREGPYKQAVPYKVSAHTSDLYVYSFENVKWGNLALKWVEAQGDENKLNAFYNDHLGLPRPKRAAAGAVTMSAADRLIDVYPRLMVYDDRRKWQGAQHGLPIDPVFVGVAIDKQDGYFKFVIGAFCPRGEIYVLDWGSLADWQDVTQLLRDFSAKAPNGQTGGFYAGLMDCGFSRSSVIDYCYSIGGLIPHFMPSRGWKEITSRGTVWPSEDKSSPGRVVTIVNFDSQYFETNLYRYRMLEWSPTRSNRNAPRLHLPIDVDESFKKELTNAHQVDVPKKDTGITVPMWQKAREHDANDFADCVKNLIILWAIHAPEVEDDPAESA